MTRLRHAEYVLDVWLRLAASLNDAPSSVRRECTERILEARRERAAAVAEIAMTRTVLS